MQPGRTKYDIKYLAVSAALVVICAFVFFLWDTAKYSMRQLLETRFTYFLIWITTVVIFVTHYFRLRSKDVLNKTIITRQFGDFVDNAIGGVGFATSITTALTLLKGLFIQTFFEDKQYFTEFNDLDLTTVFALMMFLLYYSLMRVVEIARETYLAQHTEQVLTKGGIEVLQEEDKNVNKNS